MPRVRQPVTKRERVNENGREKMVWCKEGGPSQYFYQYLDLVRLRTGHYSASLFLTYPPSPSSSPFRSKEYARAKTYKCIYRCLCINVLRIFMQVLTCKNVHRHFFFVFLFFSDGDIYYEVSMYVERIFNEMR